MPAQAVQMMLPTGDVIWAKVAVDGPTNVSMTSLQNLDIDELRGMVRGLSESLRQSLADLSPDEFEVEFGIELSLKAGKIVSMLAEAGATASVKVSLRWTADRVPPESDPAPAPPQPNLPPGS